MKCGLHASVLLKSAYLLGWEEDTGENRQSKLKGTGIFSGTRPRHTSVPRMKDKGR